MFRVIRRRRRRRRASPWRPIGRARGDDCSALGIDTEHGRATSRCSGRVARESVVPESVVRMPASRAGCEDDKARGCAVAAGRERQPILDREFTAIAFVADDRVLAAEILTPFQARALEHPVIGTVNTECSFAIHKLSVAQMISAVDKPDPGELVFGPIDEVVAPESRQGAVVGRREDGVLVKALLPARQGGPPSSLRTCQQQVLPLRNATFPPRLIYASRWSRIGDDQYSSCPTLSTNL